MHMEVLYNLLWMLHVMRTIAALKSIATQKVPVNVPHSGENGLNAFIWDSSRLEHEAAEDCELTTAGEYFGRSGYGIALRKESPWINDISLEVLKFHESACAASCNQVHMYFVGAPCAIL